jgi:hypothetical protein
MTAARLANYDVSLPYGDSVRIIQVDMVAFDSADQTIRPVWSQRNCLNSVKCARVMKMSQTPSDVWVAPSVPGRHPRTNSLMASENPVVQCHHSRRLGY